MQVLLQYIYIAFRIGYMKMLEFEKKKRDTPLTVRLTKDTVIKLKQITEKHNVSQADVIERLIDSGYEEMTKGKSKKSKL